MDQNTTALALMTQEHYSLYFDGSFTLNAAGEVSF
jgi:hypothetical protein